MCVHTHTQYDGFTTYSIIHIIVVGDTEKGEALLVLCEEELLAFDLQAPKYVPQCRYIHLTLTIYFYSFPEIQKPYLHSIHSSPVTVVQVYDNCSRHLYEKILELGPPSQPSANTTSVSHVTCIAPYNYSLIMINIAKNFGCEISQ